MKYLLAFALAAGLSFHAMAQAEIAEKINQELWKPFKKSWEARDAEAFIQLHTEDVLRITKTGIRKGEAYRKSIRESYARTRDQQRTIDFWLEHRVYTGDNGYEVGYFRITGQAANGEPNYYYGRFSILLRKEDGQWKIAQDWDVDQINGVPITKADFDKGTLLDLE